MAAEQGKAAFFLSSGSSGAATMFPDNKEEPADQIIVNVETLDRLVEQQRLCSVRLVKVDAEGAEDMVFSGAANTFRKYRPYLWFEVNPDARRDICQLMVTLTSELENYGYTRFLRVAGVASGLEQDARRDQNLQNVFAVHRDRQVEFESILRRRRNAQSRNV
jgi:hypothetical protein